MTRCASKLSSAILDLKFKERSLKVINDESGANVERLEISLKIMQAEMGQGETITVEIGVSETVEEPRSLTHHLDAFSTEQS